MKLKKMLSSLVAAVVMASLLLTGCGKTGSDSKDTTAATTQATVDNKMVGNMYKVGLPLVKEKETIKILMVQDPAQPANDIDHWKEIEAETNVHVEWTQVAPANWKEKKGLVVASNDLPDAFFGMNVLSDLDVVNYGSQGILIPIEQLAEQWAPNFIAGLRKYPELKKQITTSDSHIYAIPGFDDGAIVYTDNPMYINKTWLDKLGLAVPTTTDELVAVLKAFKERDPNGNGKADEIPMTWHKDRYPTDWFGAFGVISPYLNSASGSNNVWVKNGKAIYSPIQPEFKEALKYFNFLYSQGLVDKEAFTQDTATFNAKWKAEERIVGVFQTWRTNYAADYIPIAPLKGPNGTSMWPAYPTGLHHRGNFAITKTAAKPELIMRWADNCLSDDHALQMAFSAKIGPNWQKNADGTIKVILAPGDNPKGATYAVGTGKFYFVTKENGNRFLEIPAHITEKNEADALYKPFYPQEEFPKVFFDAKESDALATLNNDLAPYVRGQYAKWVMQGNIDAEWDAYVKQLNDMKLGEYMDIHQKAMDRYNATK